MGINKIILLGNCGKDPEMKLTKNDHKMTRFSLAVNSGWGDKKKVEWFTIVSFDKTAEFINTYLKKGQQVYVEGRFQSRKDETGKTWYEIISENISLLSRGEKTGGESEPEDSQPF